MKWITKRLILRDLTAKDITENINNLKVSKYLLVVSFPYNIKDAKCFVNRCRKDSMKKERNNYELGIELKSIKRVIGIIGLLKVNRFHGTAELGYWLGEKYWRQGIMSEALNILIDFGFNNLKLRKIVVSTFKENKASNSLIKKIRI